MAALDQGGVIEVHADTVSELPEEMGDDLSSTADPFTGLSADEDRYLPFFHDNLPPWIWNVRSERILPMASPCMVP
jgi:hypothetical protein